MASLYRCEQRGHGEIQGLRNAEEAEHGDVALALLNVTNIGGGEACPGRECPLGQVSLLSIVPEGRPKQHEEPRRIA